MSMTTLAQHHQALGARLAGDQIPLDYGDQLGEFQAAGQAAILLDRSHEGRILLTGRDRLELVNRMSTNDVAGLEQDEGCATIFTNANARILFRALCLHQPQGLLLISEAGQGPSLAAYLSRNIFFGDQAHVQDISGSTAQFAIHGPRATDIMESLAPGSRSAPVMSNREFELDGIRFALARRKALCGDHWLVMCSSEDAARVHKLLLQCGSAMGMRPAGSLTYNLIRIRSGRPAGLELSAEYLPLEVGLWDEISFSKGCYTGQEINARMESRQRQARVLVRLDLAGMAAAPADVFADGKLAGRLTSSAQAADGQIFALAVLRLSHAHAGRQVRVGERHVEATVNGLAGAPAPFVAQLVEQA